MVVRWIAALVAFLIVALIGVSGFGNFETGIDPGSFFDTEGANSFALILAIALVVGLHRLRRDRIPADAVLRLDRPPVRHAHDRAHADRDRDQHHPGRRPSPNALKLPDLPRLASGPSWSARSPGQSPGRLTGLLANLLWTYVIPPPFQNGPAAAFAIVAAIIGLIAGMVAGAWAGCARVRIGRIGELAIGGHDHDRRRARHVIPRLPRMDIARVRWPSRLQRRRLGRRSSPSSAGSSCCWSPARWSACCSCCSCGATWRPPTWWSPGW